MAETDDGELAAKKRRWNCLNQLTALLSEGTVRLEDLVSELEKDQPLKPLSFSRKAKRSPRTGSKPTHEEKPESSSARVKITFKNLPPAAGSLPIKRKKVSDNALPKPKKKQPRFDIRKHIMTELPGLPDPVQPELRGLPDPGPPSEFVEYIMRNNGRPESLVLLIEKKLFNTDVSPSHARLSVPFCQVKRPFLLKEEVEKLKADRVMKVKLLQPNVEKCSLSLALWESNSTYVLNGGWTEVMDTNKLVIGTSVRLWSYRKTNSKLRFVLAKVE
ncbi:hypothetical protein STAS_15799 [Striga asiatica]|uniref:B3 domain-containing protein n=1 Tax=Striga asiatica TaxID=4170 RepID=A0A5A7Q223_STRAF|nr:hypothetical protein STAS_15799 [Striga asiatica]